MKFSTRPALKPQFNRTLLGLWYILLVLTFSLYIIRQLYDGPYGKDFTIFLTGAHIIARSQGADLYDLATQSEVQRLVGGSVSYPGSVLPFNYPPYVAFFFLPLAFLPINIAYYVWVAFLWVILLGLLFSARSHLQETSGATVRSPFIIFFSFVPLFEAVLMGQMSIPLIALWWWAYLSLRKGRQTELGIAVALAAFKPQMVVLLAVGLVAQKQWRAVGSAAAATALLWLVPLLFTGPAAITSYLGILQLSASAVGTLGFYPGAMPNLRGLMTIFGGSSDIALQVSLAAWFLSVVAAASIWRATWPLAVRFGLMVLLAVLFSPHLYLHDTSLLVLSCVALLSTDSARSGSAGLAWLLLPFAGLFISLYSLVLLKASAYPALILSTWLLGALLVALLLRRGGRVVAQKEPSPG